MTQYLASTLVVPRAGTIPSKNRKPKEVNSMKINILINWRFLLFAHKKPCFVEICLLVAYWEN